MTFLLCLFFMLFMLFFASQNLAVEEESIMEVSQNPIYRNANPLDLDKIIEENVLNNVKE